MEGDESRSEIVVGLKPEVKEKALAGIIGS